MQNREAPNIGLQRTAPCGLAAELGSLGDRRRVPHSLKVGSGALCLLLIACATQHRAEALRSIAKLRFEVDGTGAGLDVAAGGAVTLITYADLTRITAQLSTTELRDVSTGMKRIFTDRVVAEAKRVNANCYDCKTLYFSWNGMRALFLVNDVPLEAEPILGTLSRIGHRYFGNHFDLPLEFLTFRRSYSTTHER
jgi:hypothetical protein